MKINYNKKELSLLKNNYFMARALCETIKETAEEIQKNILFNNEFYESEECPENRNFDSWQERNPCGQQNCWVDCHCGKI